MSEDGLTPQQRQWRRYLDERTAQEEAARKAAEEPSAPDASPSLKLDEGDALPRDPARIKVRGTKDNDATEEVLQIWEKGVRADAAANGGVVPPKCTGRGINAAVRLTEPKPDMPAPSDTETELNGLIAECRYLMHEVAMASACLSYDPEDRIRFLSSAQGLALTASKIGRTVAGLRAAGRDDSAVETHRHEMVYTHVTSPLPPVPEADSAKQ